MECFPASFMISSHKQQLHWKLEPQKSLIVTHKVEFTRPHPTCILAKWSSFELALFLEVKHAFYSLITFYKDQITSNY